MAKLRCIPLPGKMVGFSLVTSLYLPLFAFSLPPSLPTSSLPSLMGVGKALLLPRVTLSLEFQVLATWPSTFFRDLFPSTLPSVLPPATSKITQNFTTFKMPFLSLMFPYCCCPSLLLFRQSVFALGLGPLLSALPFTLFWWVLPTPSPLVSHLKGDNFQIVVSSLAISLGGG